MWSVRGGWIALALALGFICAQRARAEEKIKIIQVTVATDTSKGWGLDEPLPDDLKAQQVPEKFTRVPISTTQPQTFSGKVMDVKPEQKVEVGVVSLIGSHWLNNGNYEWFPVNASRVFSVVSKNHPEANKTLLVRAEGNPWTFLRAKFDPGEGAKDIELHVKPTVKAVITMEDSEGNPIASFRGEVFNAYAMTDNHGNVLAMQRFGHPQSKNGAMPLDLPPEPVSILLEAGPTVAQYYAFIDPREANHFHFKMLAASRIKGIVTRDGKPATDLPVYSSNDAAPLSASHRRTDATGHFDFPGRRPGTYRFKAGSYQTNVDLKPGETVDLKIDLSANGAPAQ
jgi:hypothetical protein